MSPSAADPNGSSTSSTSVIWSRRIGRREALEHGAEQRERGHERGVPVAREHLRRHRGNGELEPRADVLLDLGRHARVGADGAGDLPDGDLRRRRREAGPRAAHLVDEVGELDAEGERLRVDPVGAAHHHGEPVPLGLLDQRRDERLGVLVDDTRGVAELGGERGVDDVRRGQAEVEVPPRLADGLLDRGDEGGHVVPLLGLELGDAFGIDAGRSAAHVERLDGNAAELGPTFTREQLDVQPALQS